MVGEHLRKGYVISTTNGSGKRKIIGSAFIIICLTDVVTPIMRNTTYMGGKALESVKDGSPIMMVLLIFVWIWDIDPTERL